MIVVIGSAWHARDPRNPFTWQERQQQFESVLNAEERARVSFLPVRDYFDDERWAEPLRDGVARLTTRDQRITLVGFKKDHTSSIWIIFPGWSLHEVDARVRHQLDGPARIYFELEQDLPAALAMIGSYVEPGVTRVSGSVVDSCPPTERCADRAQEP